MRALVKLDHGAGAVELRDVPEPLLSPTSVAIDVAAVAICGTDRIALEGGHGGKIPRILGHEVSGRIAQIGPHADRPELAVGDRVTVETDAYLCRRCQYCRKEEFNRCPNRLGIGTTSDGGLADRLVMPADAVHALPETVSLVEGALTEPLAVAVHAVVERSPSLAGEVVVVIGPGSIGMLTAQVATAVGATVVLVGRSRHTARLSAALSLGVAHTVDAESEDLTARVMELTQGYGAHTVFECSGASGVLESAPALLRRGGRIVLQGFFRNPPSIDIDRVVNHELEVIGSRGKRASSYRTALRMMAHGQVRLEPVVGSVLPLARWREGIDLVGQGVKVVLTVDDELTG